jgi:pantothenate kinase
MLGPLRKLQAHRSIHDGAFAEAKNLTELLEQLYVMNVKTICLKSLMRLLNIEKRELSLMLNQMRKNFTKKKS